MSERECTAEYSIKAVAQATGLTVETLRAWERRYGVIEPKRGVSGHRIYTSGDVTRLRRLRETTDRGHAIGKIAHLSDDDLGSLLSDRAGDRAATAATRALIERILSAIEKFQPEECDQAIAMAFALLPASDVILEVISPALREVGERWHRGEFSIVQERIVSGAVRRQVNGLLNTYNRTSRGATVVFATCSGEHHELGILMYAALAATYHLRVCYLGADLPPGEIATCARHVNAAAVAVSLIMPEDLQSCVRQLAELRRCLPAAVEIWIGGAAASHLETSQFPDGSIHMAGRRDFERRVDLLTARNR